MSWLALALALFGSHVSCQTKGESPIPKDTNITLDRSGCYGTCPIYRLTIEADGSVTFEGRDYVKTKGTAKGHISQEQLRQLISEFEKIDYFSLRERYQDADDGCPSFATDMPSADTSIQMNSRKKSVSHYLGCWERGGDFKIYPAALYKLEEKIDEIVNSKQWIK